MCKIEKKSDAELMAEVGATLRGVRRLLGLSLGEGARVLGITPAVLSDIERGKRECYEGYPRHAVLTMAFHVLRGEGAAP